MLTLDDIPVCIDLEIKKNKTFFFWGGSCDLDNNPDEDNSDIDFTFDDSSQGRIQ